MLFLLILQIFLLNANTNCEKFGLQEINTSEAEKQGTTNDWDISFTQFCIFEHEFFVILEEKAYPTCIGFHLDENQICDATKVVCCGENETFGNFELQKQHLGLIEEHNSFLHPDCPRNEDIIFFALPIESASSVSFGNLENAEMTLGTREMYEENSFEEEESNNDEFEEQEKFYEVTLDLFNINIDAFEDPQNRILLMHCLQILISADVHIMKYLGSQQSEDGSGYVFLELNIDLKNELKLETNIILITNWLLNINENMFQLNSHHNEGEELEDTKIVNSNTLTFEEENTTQSKNLNIDDGEENLNIITTKSTSNQANKNNAEEEENVLMPNIFLWLFILVVITSIFCLSGVAFHVYIKYYAPGCEHKSVTSFQNLKEPDLTNVFPVVKQQLRTSSQYSGIIDYNRHSEFVEKKQKNDDGDDHEISFDQHFFLPHGLNLPAKQNIYHQTKQQDDFKVDIGIDSDGEPGHNFIEYGHNEEKEESSSSSSSERKMMIQFPHNSTSSFLGENVYTSSIPVDEADGQEDLSDYSETDTDELFSICSPREKRSSIYKFQREHPQLNEMEGFIEYAPTPDGIVKNHIIIGENENKIEGQQENQSDINEHGGGRYSIGQDHGSYNNRKIFFSAGQNSNHNNNMQKFELLKTEAKERDGDFNQTCLDEKFHIAKEVVRGVDYQTNFKCVSQRRRFALSI